MFGAPAPAYANGALVVAGARGEVTYFNADDGGAVDGFRRDLQPFAPQLRVLVILGRTLFTMAA